MYIGVIRNLAAMVFAVVGLTGAAAAADLLDGTPRAYCVAGGGAAELVSYGDQQLRSEVVRLMDEAVATADSDRWVGSPRPVFVWANEAKAACGKAYGYLQSNVRDEDYLAKCACFHNRMLRFMH